MGSFFSGDGTGFEEILINSNKSDGVSTRNIRDIFDGSTHHKNGSLDGFDVEIVFFTGFVIRSHDSDFFSGFDGSREHSSESEESRFIGGGHHFGDVHHDGTVGVTFFHGL